MLGRFSKIAALIWAVVWFVVVIPAHTRGVVQMDDTAQPTGCCPESCPPDNSDDDSESTNPSGCAICHLAAHLQVPHLPDAARSINLLPCGDLLAAHAVERLAFWPGARCDRGPPVRV